MRIAGLFMLTLLLVAGPSVVTFAAEAGGTGGVVFASDRHGHMALFTHASGVHTGPSAVAGISVRQPPILGRRIDEQFARLGHRSFHAAVFFDLGLRRSSCLGDARTAALARPLLSRASPGRWRRSRRQRDAASGSPPSALTAEGGSDRALRIRPARARGQYRALAGRRRQE